MNTISNCCCGSHTTPWCEMLGGGAEKNVLHLYYKLEWLQEEIEKRTSYLGKFRRTEEAKHLLDLISMTKDEEDLFYPFARAAMADVFDVLRQYIPDTTKSVYVWNEDANLVVINSISESAEVARQNDGYAYYDNQSGEMVIWQPFILQSNSENLPLYKLFIRADATHTICHRIKATDEEVVIGTRNESYGMALTIPTPYMGQQIFMSKNFPSQLTFSPETEVVTGEYVKSSTVEYKSYYLWKEPTEFETGDYVNLDDVLYRAVAAGDANDTIDKLVRTEDYRKSIEYLIAFPKDMNINLANPLDTAVYEALTSRIIYKWLQYSYPDEAARYLSEWSEYMEQIRKRIKDIYGAVIVHRIPRP